MLIFTLLKPFWKHILIVTIVSTLAFSGYNYIYNKGKNAAEVACAVRMRDFNNKLDTLITRVEKSSADLIKQSQESNTILKKDVSKILDTIKNKPLYTIEQGKCTPTNDFIDTYNKVIDRVNK